MTHASRKVVIVGAGLSGSMMASYLGRRGYRVDVVERRSDPRVRAQDDAGRSINLGLSERGIRSLRDIGLLDSLWECTVPMRGRAIHRPNGHLSFQPYGTNESQILYSILRRDLNVALIENASSYPGVSFTFDTRLVALDKEKVLAHFIDEQTGAPTTAEADFIVGADGVFSVVRREMQRGERADFDQRFLEWGYKELTIPAAPDGSARTRLEALHVWPGEQGGLIVAHPNRDNSLTGTLFLPLETLDSLTSPDAVQEFLHTHFPDTASLMPDAVEEFGVNPVGTLVCVRTSQWHFEDSVVLVGDACHAVYPFYGQGMNSSFEDCTELDACIGRHPDDLAAAFAEYQHRRKRHTDVLADLSAQNFVELRDRLSSPLHVLLKKADLALNKAFPKSWMPLYTMVSHTTIPYADALRRAERQHAILKAAGTTLAAAVALPVLRQALRRRRSTSSPRGLL
jgi:kynurenine 3-monooxygenase